MSDPQSELDIFNRISTEQIIELGNYFDDSILSPSPNLSKLKKILDKDFEISSVKELISIFYNFAISKRNPDKIFKIITTSKLDEDKKKMLKEIVQKIHDKINLDDVSISLTANFLHTFGHAHIHGFKTVTEFRPISNGREGIKKIIPSLVVSINTHESDNGVDNVINFQLTLKDAKKLIEELNSGSDLLKTEIQDFRNKFGEDIIDRKYLG